MEETSHLQAVQAVNQVKIRWVVFQLRRDVNHLNLWQRHLFEVWLKFSRFCERHGLPTLVDPEGAQIELQAVASTEAVANAIAAQIGKLAFYKKAPLDATLPKANVVFGGNKWPGSDFSEMYAQAGEDEVIQTICPFTTTACRPHDSVSMHRVLKAYNQLDSTLKEGKKFLDNQACDANPRS